MSLSNHYIVIRPLFEQLSSNNFFMCLSPHYDFIFKSETNWANYLSLRPFFLFLELFKNISLTFFGLFAYVSPTYLYISSVEISYYEYVCCNSLKLFDSSSAIYWNGSGSFLDCFETILLYFFNYFGFSLIGSAFLFLS